ESVARAISTKLAVNTYFYKITADMDSPQKSLQLLQAVIKVFLSTGAQDGSGDAVKDDARKRLEAKLKDTNDQIKNLQTEIIGVQREPAAPARDDKLTSLNNQLISLQSDETSILAAIAQIGDSSGPRDIATVVDQPRLGKKLGTGLVSNVIMAFAVSLVLGAGLAFLRDYLDYTVHTPEQMEEVLGMRALASIGQIGSGGRRGPLSFLGGLFGGRRKRRGGARAGAGEVKGGPLVTLGGPNSSEAESFRVLRTNIQFTSLDRPIRSLVVTSTAPQEGKSFVASNLAVVMAQAGKRVILIDADLRRPKLHELFGLSNKVGFTDVVLAGSTGVPGAVQMVPGVNNLAVITSGALPPNPSELLDSRQAAKVMEQLTQQTDILVIDSPPAGAVTDPIIVATRVDAAIMVISAGKTRRDAIARTRLSLENVGVSTLLPVLNRVATTGMRDFYGYRATEDEVAPTAATEESSFVNGKVPAQPAGVETAPTGSQRGGHASTIGGR
ncbi:MAG: polysaccharide biosynthesis tyrosine autokinase, partial [Chloroflexia bacterium]